MDTDNTFPVFPWKKMPKNGTKAKDIPHLREELKEKFGEEAEAILRMMWLKPKIRIRDLSKCLGRAPTAVYMVIKDMKEAHILQRIGSSTHGYWKILRGVALRGEKSPRSISGHDLDIFVGKTTEHETEKTRPERSR